ncbi:MAG: hypothetical protein KC994_06300 [Candidatus Omnitrophica bacterium]|nr:hypothetical protein [Candidatus Omnitrophota bacterium]
MRTCPFRLATLLFLCLLAVHPVESQTPTPVPTIEQKVVIDLDRNSEGIQDLVTYNPNSANIEVIQGEVLVLGASTDMVGDYALSVWARNPDNKGAIDCENSEILDGEVVSDLGTNHCRSIEFRHQYLFVESPVPIGTDGFLVVFKFNLVLDCKPGDLIELEFVTTSENPQLGIFLNDEAYGVNEGTSNPIESIGGLIYCTESDATPTPSTTPTYASSFTSTPTPTPTPFPTRDGPPTDNPLFERKIAIDLDRLREGIQDSLVVSDDGEKLIAGAVIVVGDPTDSVRDFDIQLNARKRLYETSINCENTQIVQGEITASSSRSFCGRWSLDVSESIASQDFYLGLDGRLVLFEFNIDLICQSEDIIGFGIAASTSRHAILFNDSIYTFGRDSSNPIRTDDAIVECVDLSTQPTDTPLPTFTPAPPCEDPGYFILDVMGGRHTVGNPPAITGHLYYGRDVARDLEIVSPSDAPDLAILDAFGAVQYVQNPGAAPPQMFYWPEGTEPPNGPAVDLVLSRDGQGFWVLTERGGIYRAGSTLPPGEDPLLGNDAEDLTGVLGIPFGGEVPRAPSLPQNDNASIRAVSLVVVQTEDPLAPDGYIVIDSQGGHYLFDSIGNFRDNESPGSLLNADSGANVTVYPFFQGLDIVRDLEPTADESAAILLDGWGGVHPIPVEFGENNPVAFIRNEPPAQVDTLGLPYIQVGFDNPSTEEDEGDPESFGIDANSIFRDLELCEAGGGVYVLDAFGGVFAFGNTRRAMGGLLPYQGVGPYFFPNLYAVDLEAMGQSGF